MCRAKDPLNKEKIANKVKYYKDQIVSTEFKVEKNTTTNSSYIANKFNRHFASVAKQIEEKLIKPKDQYS